MCLEMEKNQSLIESLYKQNVSRFLEYKIAYEKESICVRVKNVEKTILTVNFFYLLIKCLSVSYTYVSLLSIYFQLGKPGDSGTSLKLW